ncbi:hypothetical protein DICPUDRAFT_46996, partial [Dictyostelium purpureum]
MYSNMDNSNNINNINSNNMHNSTGMHPMMHSSDPTNFFHHQHPLNHSYGGYPFMHGGMPPVPPPMFHPNPFMYGPPPPSQPHHIHSHLNSSAEAIMLQHQQMLHEQHMLQQQQQQQQQDQQYQQQQQLHQPQKQTENTQDDKPKPPTLNEIFDDLSSRFVLNIPAEELSSFERLLFQIEAAYWFYDDFYREDFPQLPKYSMAEFTKNFFSNCPILKHHQTSVEEILKSFSDYKTKVPVFGAIILNQDLDKALFVRGYGSNNSWGFPKGKVNKDESDADCAVREVFEETSFDIAPYLNERHFIELNIKEQKIKLYIVAGVPEPTQFYPRTRKEIGKIEWVLIDDLPTIGGKKTSGSKERNFYRSFPFFNRLRKWVQLRKLKYPKELYATTPISNPNNQNQLNNSNNGIPTQQQQQQVSTPKNNKNLAPPNQYSPYPMSPPTSPRDQQQQPQQQQQQQPITQPQPQLQQPIQILK